MDSNTFDEFLIMKGKRVDTSSIMSSFIGTKEVPSSVGKFKGWIELFSLKWRDGFD